MFLDTLFGLYDRVSLHLSNRRKVFFSDAYGWAYDDADVPGVIRIYLRGTFTNGSDKPISLLSVQLLPTRKICIAAKEAPFLIAGVGDAKLMATEFPVSVQPLAACKIDTIFHCQSAVQEFLRLPSVGIRSKQAAMEILDHPQRVGHDPSGIQWMARLCLRTSRGEVRLRVPVDWREYTYTFFALSARNRLNG